MSGGEFNPLPHNYATEYNFVRLFVKNDEGSLKLKKFMKFLCNTLFGFSFEIYYYFVSLFVTLWRLIQALYG